MSPGDSIVPSETPDPCSRRRASLAALAVVVTVFLARLVLIHRWGTNLPFWDEWDAGALGTYLPWIRGDFGLQQLFAAHNEHRIVFTHLENLALFFLNGRWSPLLQMTVNAALHASVAGLLALILLPQLAWPLSRRVTLAMVVIFASPFGWQNALWGFQSQFYFTELFSVVCLWGLLAPVTAWSLRWWLGLGAGLAGLVSTAGGLLAPVCVTLCCIGSASARVRPWRDSWPTITTGFFLTAIGLAISAPTPQHQGLHAAGVAEFLSVFSSALAWPNIDLRPVVLLSYAPWLVLGAGIAWSRRATATELLVLNLGFYAILHAAAVALTRGHGLPDGMPISRYEDSLALGAIANIAALAIIATRIHSRRKSLWRISTAAWAALFILGLARLTLVNLTVHLPFKTKSDRMQLENLTQYVTTHDFRALEGKSLFEIGHTDPHVIRKVLDDPALSPKLPAVLQNPKPRPTPLETFNSLLLRSGGWLIMPSALWLLVVLYSRNPRPDGCAST